MHVLNVFYSVDGAEVELNKVLQIVKGTQNIYFWDAYQVKIKHQRFCLTLFYGK